MLPASARVPVLFLQADLAFQSSIHSPLFGPSCLSPSPRRQTSDESTCRKSRLNRCHQERFGGATGRSAGPAQRRGQKGGRRTVAVMEPGGGQRHTVHSKQWGGHKDPAVVVRQKKRSSMWQGDAFSRQRPSQSEDNQKVGEDGLTGGRNNNTEDGHVAVSLCCCATNCFRQF